MHLNVAIYELLFLLFRREIAIQLKRQDMAAYAGTTYETFFRMTAELVTGKAIEINGKRLKILDKSKLESYCDNMSHIKLR